MADVAARPRNLASGAPAWTDYPFVELGDAAFQMAPVRRVEIVGYDGDRYAQVEVDGVLCEVKRFYLYRRPMRLDDIRHPHLATSFRLARKATISRSKLLRLRRQVRTRAGGRGARA